MDTSMPFLARQHLNDCYEAARLSDLQPIWHEDADGFDYLCPHCVAAGLEDHYVHMRMEPRVVFLDADVANGPAA